MDSTPLPVAVAAASTGALQTTRREVPDGLRRAALRGRLLHELAVRGATASFVRLHLRHLDDLGPDDLRAIREALRGVGTIGAAVPAVGAAAHPAALGQVEFWAWRRCREFASNARQGRLGTLRRLAAHLAALCVAVPLGVGALGAAPVV